MDQILDVLAHRLEYVTAGQLCRILSSRGHSTSKLRKHLDRAQQAKLIVRSMRNMPSPIPAVLGLSGAMFNEQPDCVANYLHELRREASLPAEPTEIIRRGSLLTGLLGLEHSKSLEANMQVAALRHAEAFIQHVESGANPDEWTLVRGNLFFGSIVTSSQQSVVEKFVVSPQSMRRKRFLKLISELNDLETPYEIW